MSAAPRHIPTSRDNRRASLAMGGAALGFALMAVLAHGMRNDLPWPVVAFARCLSMLLVMAVLLAARRAPLVLLGNRALWLRSLFGTLGLLTTFYCLSRMPVADTVVIFAMSPIWIAVIMARMGHGRVTRATWLHLALAIGGVLVMQRPSFSVESLPLAVAVAGSVAVAAAMVSLSLTRDYPRETVVMHFSLCATLATMLFSAAVLDRLPPVLGGAPLHYAGLLAAMGCCGTAGQLLMTAAYQRGRPTLMALVGLSQIVIGAAFDVALFGYPMDLFKGLGILLIGLGIGLNLAHGAPPEAAPQA